MVNILKIKYFYFKLNKTIQMCLKLMALKWELSAQNGKIHSGKILNDAMNNLH